MTESVYWIWFQLLFGIGTRRAELFQEYFASPREIYDGIAARNQVLGMLEAGELSNSASAMERAVRVERRTRKKGCDIITPDHPSYPRLLLPIYSRPAVLYVKGDLSCLEGALAIAMVGARQHTKYGKEAANHLAKGLCANGAVVVSGLAHGIDSESHRGALAAGGKTVGVLGCGIDIDYPLDSAKLKRAISENGAVITEYPLGVTPFAANFPLRNRIISGMSHGVLVVEADLRSGSLITARYAREQGRDLFAVPGSIFHRGEQGTHLLIKEGARLVDSVDDVLNQYPQFYRKRLKNPSPVDVASTKPPMEDDDPANQIGAQAKPKAKRSAKKAAKSKQALPDGITEGATQVYAQFGQGTLSVDDLSGSTGMSTGDILSALTELEIYGLLQSYPGRQFGLL